MSLTAGSALHSVPDTSSLLRRQNGRESGKSICLQLNLGQQSAVPLCERTDLNLDVCDVQMLSTPNLVILGRQLGSARGDSDSSL